MLKICACIVKFKSKGHCTLSPKFLHAFFRFFRIPHSFQSKCMLRMRKRRKSNLIRIFWNGRKFRRQCANVIDTTWGRIYFLTWENFRQKFRTQCAETLSSTLSLNYFICVWIFGNIHQTCFHTQWLNFMSYCMDSLTVYSTSNAVYWFISRTRMRSLNCSSLSCKIAFCFNLKFVMWINWS